MEQILQVPKPGENQPQLSAATYGCRLRTLITTYLSTATFWCAYYIIILLIISCATDRNSIWWYFGRSCHRCNMYLSPLRCIGQSFGTSLNKSWSTLFSEPLHYWIWHLFSIMHYLENYYAIRECRWYIIITAVLLYLQNRTIVCLEYPV